MCKFQLREPQKTHGRGKSDLLSHHTTKSIDGSDTYASPRKRTVHRSHIHL